MIMFINTYSFISYRYQKKQYIYKPLLYSQEEDESQFGVSFIGQDVCGSKYNDDPFVEIDKKPDAFAEFEKRLKAIEERNNNNNNNNNNKTVINSGKWP